MALKINQNVFSMLVQRNLEKASVQYQDSLNKLSSGDRLSKAADDPAAMASSEALRFQLTGLRQNQLNLSGTSSLLGTAESQLDNMTNLLQSARTLAVQAGNETLNASDRQTLQTQLDDIKAELNRIANSAKYGDQYLLNGQLQNMKIQIGTSSTETLSLTLPDLRVGALGAFAQVVTSGVNGTALAAGAASINGVAVPATVQDGISTVNPAASAIAKATAINSIESQTGVHAAVQPSTLTGVNAITPVSLNGTSSSLTINGVNMGILSVAAGDSGQALVARINTYTNQTGVTASVDANGKLALTATDGRNFTVATTGNIADELGLAATNSDITSTVTGAIKLTSVNSFQVTNAGGELGLATSPLSVAPDSTQAIANLSVNDTTSTANALNSIDAALSQISKSLSTVGSLSNRLDSLGDLLTSQITQLTSADSKLRDTDFAMETTRYTQSQILQEAALSMLAQANVMPSKALELLQSR